MWTAKLGFYDDLIVNNKLHLALTEFDLRKYVDGNKKRTKAV